MALRDITADHVRLALPEIDRDGYTNWHRGLIKDGYELLEAGKAYSPKYVISIAHKNVDGQELSPGKFSTNQANAHLTGLGFMIQSRSETPLDETNSSKYTWIPFYQELCPKLHQYSTAELIGIVEKVLKVQGLRGLQDQDAAGNPLKLEDIDPYSFLSFIGRGSDEKRLSVLAGLKEWLPITAPVPTDLDGLHTLQNQWIWLFGYSYERQPNDINFLWVLYHQVDTDAVTEDMFNQVLEITRLSPDKLSESLFTQRPNQYLPVNSYTKAWLKSRGLTYKYSTLAEYRQLLDEVRQHDPRPFYEISEEAYQEADKLTNGDKGEVNYWVFQSNPVHFNILESLKNNALSAWRVAAHRQRIKPGDKVIFWISGPKPGCYALAQVTSDLFPGLDDELMKKYQTGDSGKKPTERVHIKILLNLWDRPVTKADMQGLPVFDGFKGGNQGTNFRATREQYEAILNMRQNQSVVQEDVLTKPSQPEEVLPMIDRYPKNIILYGPPGTGKTYRTIDLAVDIVDGEKDSEHMVNKVRFDQLRADHQIEFITFHQNYTYEDFVMGLKPDVDGEDLKFQRSYGIFYQMAKRARDNYEASRSGTATVRPFQEVFDAFMKPLVEEGKEIEVTMASGIKFVLYDLSERSVSFRKPNGSTIHTLSIATLRGIYESIQEVRPNGLKPYYRPLSDELARLGHQTNQRVTPKNYVLIIDEINRANMSRVFGELITLLEEDKRLGAENALIVTLPSGESFSVPPNLYLIGTMNTADKSLALLDIALRRRFEFIGIYPEYEVIEGPARGVLERLNKAILAHHKPADFLIGHAYFMGKQPDQLPGVFNNRVIPLLMEYFNGRTDLVKTLLKDAGIDSERHPFTDQLTVDHVG